MDSKLLTELGWKTMAVKFKIKDNTLQKALAVAEKVAETDYEALIKALSPIIQLAENLKKTKEVSGMSALAKYLEDMSREAAAAKAKAAKCKEDAAKRQDAARKRAEALAKEKEEEDISGDYGELLLTAFKKLRGAKDVVYEFVICDAKPLGLMLAKQITAQHRTALTKATGGKRFFPVGTCVFEEGKFNFDMEKPLPGMAKRLQETIKTYTGKKMPIKVGTESAEGEDEAGAAGQAAGEQAAAGGAEAAAAPPVGAFRISASVGHGGKNNPSDVMAVQTALNAKARAGLVVDGKCGNKTILAILKFQKTLAGFKPDGLVEPGRKTAHALARMAAGGAAAPAAPAPGEAPSQPEPPKEFGKPDLAKAPDVWHGTRKVVDATVAAVKKAVEQACSDEHPNLVKEITDNLGKLDGILDNLDTELAESLSKAAAAKEAAAKQGELKNAKRIIAEYIGYIKSEPLIAHVDANPFGVKSNLKKVLGDSLTHIAQSIG